MNPDPSIPPLRDLPAGRLEAHHAHLLREIGRGSRSRLRSPTVTWTSPRVAAVAAASAAAAAAVALVVAGSWGGGTPSRRPTPVDALPRLAFAIHVAPERGKDSLTSDYRPIPAGDVGDTAATGYVRYSGGRVPAAVYSLARWQAATNGDEHPSALEWIKTTRQLAVSSQSGDTVDSPSEPVYFVVLYGHFVDKNAYCICVGAKGSTDNAPKGTVLSFTIDRRSGQVLDFGLGTKSPDYSKLGRPHPFSLETGHAK